MKTQITWDSSASVYEVWGSTDGDFWEWLGCADDYTGAKEIAASA